MREQDEVPEEGASEPADLSESPGASASASRLDLPVDEHEEEVSENGRTVRHQGIYLLPNLFTTAALFAGFYSIIAAMRGDFENAAVAIFFAMVLDGLDGRIARLTNTSSKFGEEFDSLSDMVSFGVAPALVMFSWTLGGLG
jgi:CDP-diacylglycerol--serine O-phosphatidyltransferase